MTGATTGAGPSDPTSRHTPDMAALVERLHRVGVLPVVVLDSVDQAAPLAEALLRAGLAAAEVTFRSPCAGAGIAVMARYPELLVAAGTVRTVDQVRRAVDAGAQLVLSPGLSKRVVLACQDVGVPVVPGVATASELQHAADLGLDLVKFFPAETSGGAAAIRALSGPFPEMRFIPTGGLTPERLAAYAALPCVPAVGGSWMVTAALLRDGDWGQVTELSSRAVEAWHAATRWSAP